jgi:hypothetical protein
MPDRFDLGSGKVMRYGFGHDDTAQHWHLLHYLLTSVTRALVNIPKPSGS